jgi:D-amino-acid dehydrogenase
MRVLVIGSGIFGASTAHALAREGADVVLADEGHAGRATYAGAGIVCPWSTREENPAFYRFYEAGARYYLNLVPELEEAGIADTGYRKVGSLVIAESEAEVEEVGERLQRRVAAAPEAGQLSRLSGREAQAYFPPLRQDLTAFHLSGGARVEAQIIAASMLQVAASRGARILHGHVGIRLSGSRAYASLNGEAIEADKIVATTGAWSNDLLERVGVSIAVAPQKGQIVHMRVEGAATENWPVLLPQGSHYMLAFPGGRIVAGATRETGSGFNYRLTVGGQAEVMNFALGLAPGLASATHLETRVGFRPLHAAKTPIIDQAPGIDNLFLGNGLGASGLTMGPLAGQLLAQRILGQTPQFDLAPYAIPHPPTDHRIPDVA